MNVYKFRDCLLNTLERSVIRDNDHLELTTKTFDVLQFLIENAGNVLTKDDILGKVWNGSFVEESNYRYTSQSSDNHSAKQKIESSSKPFRASDIVLYLR
ncbi:MAG: hypothetical protein DMF63_10925 [Acidobacteria bacterium]|nr:MAG: hypothetical protein DMF63_10925 [Acidobacteriota bacterium]